MKSASGAGRKSTATTLPELPICVRLAQALHLGHVAAVELHVAGARRRRSTCFMKPIGTSVSFRPQTNSRSHSSASRRVQNPPRHAVRPGRCCAPRRRRPRGRAAQVGAQELVDPRGPPAVARGRGAAPSPRRSGGARAGEPSSGRSARITGAPAASAARLARGSSGTSAPVRSRSVRPPRSPPGRPCCCRRCVRARSRARPSRRTPSGRTRARRRARRSACPTRRSPAGRARHAVVVGQRVDGWEEGGLGAAEPVDADEGLRAGARR